VGGHERDTHSSGELQSKEYIKREFCMPKREAIGKNGKAKNDLY
jgi:hypothetical protein